jgi:hypothetical protein
MPGNDKQTTTSNSEPWAGAQPALISGLSSAQNLHSAGIGADYYRGPTVIPYSTQTMQGANGVQANAYTNSGGQGLSDQYQKAIYNGGLTPQQLQSQDAQRGIINNGGYNDATRNAMGGYQSVVDNGGYNDATRNAMGVYQGVVNRGGYNDQQNAALRNVQGLANSQYSISPELQKVLDAQSTKVSDAVNLNAAGAGRYGSGANQTLLAKNVGDLTNSTVYNDYNSFLSRRDAANNSLFNMGQTGQGNVSSAAGNIAGLGNSAQANVNSAYGSMANLGNSALANYQGAATNMAALGQQGFGNLSTAYAGLNLPYQDLMNVGSMYEDLATRQKNDELRLFDASQNAPWDNLSRLNAIASGAGQLGGSKTTSQPGQNPFLTAAGYGLSGLGLLGGI